MSKNLGQAGGWSVGLSYAALRKQHDWIWTFDNDILILSGNFVPCRMAW
jgi:hypothetical protein